MNTAGPIDLTVAISLEITDPRAFARAARARARAQGVEGRDLRRYSTRDLSACAVMLLDPGVSPDGCEIQDSSAP